MGQLGRADAAEAAVFELFDREAEDDVEAGFELAQLGAGNWFELGEDGVAGGGLLDAFEKIVVGVAGISLDEHLGGEDPLAAFADAKVDVRGAAWVANGLDGAEVVAAVRSGHETTVALKILVAAVPAIGAGVKVDARIVHLPDLHESIAHGLPAGSKDAT